MTGSPTAAVLIARLGQTGPFCCGLFARFYIVSKKLEM